MKVICKRWEVVQKEEGEKKPSDILRFQLPASIRDHHFRAQEHEKEKRKGINIRVFKSIAEQISEKS